MRFLLTFVLLLSFQSFVFCDQRGGTITDAQKINNNIALKSPAFFKLLNKDRVAIDPSSVENPTDKMSAKVPRVQSLFLPSILGNEISIDFPLCITPSLTKIVNYSYYFVLNCLYPKHSFW
ncbi:MAG: hypothetical protein EOO87_15980 [Pedobacter sp.]|nr:MAG: hypothetical protein EOO87_15980 [Pedobacter sp.]